MPGWQQKKDLDNMEDNEAIARIDNLDKVEKKSKVDPFITDGEIVKSYEGLHQNFRRKITRTVNKAFHENFHTFLNLLSDRPQDISYLLIAFRVHTVPFAVPDLGLLGTTAVCVPRAGGGCGFGLGDVGAAFTSKTNKTIINMLFKKK